MLLLWTGSKFGDFWFFCFRALILVDLPKLRIISLCVLLIIVRVALITNSLKIVTYTWDGSGTVYYIVVCVESREYCRFSHACESPANILSCMQESSEYCWFSHACRTSSLSWCHSRSTRPCQPTTGKRMPWYRKNWTSSEPPHTMSTSEWMCCL